MVWEILQWILPEMPRWNSKRHPFKSEDVSDDISEKKNPDGIAEEIQAGISKRSLKGFLKNSPVIYL